MQTILDLVVEAYRRQSFLEALNADFAALRANPEEWAEEMEERQLWEQTLADGLQPALEEHGERSQASGKASISKRI